MGNALIARHMGALFDGLPQKDRASPEEVARAYGKHLFHHRRRELIDEKRLARSPFHVGIGVDSADFTDITKRALLVSDTLLVSHNGLGPGRRVCALSERRTRQLMGARIPGSALGEAGYGSQGVLHTHTQDVLSMHCPDLAALGAWLTQVEPLLRAGLAWYLPSYAVSRGSTHRVEGNGSSEPFRGREHRANVPSALDFLLRSGRAVSESTGHPVHALKSDVVRPVLTMDLPFLEGVGMADFSRITVDYAAAYKAFQRYIRHEYLSIDSALGAVESERELIKIAHRIEDEARGIHSQLTAVRRKRAVAVSGAVVGTIGASLVAVYGPAFQSAAAVLGAAGAGGIWGIIQSAADNSPRTLRDSPWFYIWMLNRKSERFL
ncbi:hypothetical protein [Streptomyces sp. WAC 05379]|uniref:hypothetical protein n=1 Tax=Streptomyces sp. WAC 05379 TaxID=2203207 RepID=UPI000F73AFA6|nr:hypothetical protein [Streptomyces sp. WAC 05379]